MCLKKGVFCLRGVLNLKKFGKFGIFSKISKLSKLLRSTNNVERDKHLEVGACPFLHCGKLESWKVRKICPLGS